MWLTVAERRPVAPNHVELLLEAPALAEALVPGQFAHVRTDGILRRPLSFSRVDGSRVGLLFRVVGRGTAWLAERRPGQSLDLLAPLGQGFPEPPPGPVCLVGGGVGVPPLHVAAQRWRGRPLQALIGARDADSVLMVDDFRRLGVLPRVMTEDGSLGERGLVTDALVEWLADYPDGAVLACGPTPMLAAVAAQAAGRPTWLAFEQRMGCGVGACLACVVPGREGWVRVCTEGPVFAAEHIDWRRLTPAGGPDPGGGRLAPAGEAGGVPGGEDS